MIKSCNRKIKSFILCFAALFISIMSYGQVETYSYPDAIVNSNSGLNKRSTEFKVQVTQSGISKDCYVMYDKNQDPNGNLAKNPDNHWTNFSHKGAVTITVSKMSGSITSCQIFPKKKGITATVSGGKATFTIPADQSPLQLFVHINGNTDKPLFVFADPWETDVPDRNDAANVEVVKTTDNIATVKNKLISNKTYVVFEEGIHKWGGGTGTGYEGYKLPYVTGKKIYIPGGAYIIGTFSGNNQKNVKIYGRGVISGCGLDAQKSSAGIPYSMVQQDGGSSTAIVEGIHTVCPPHFAITGRGKMDVYGVKMMSWWHSTDGTIIGDNSENIGCFFKVMDDAMKIYSQNCYYENNTIYHQVNGAPFQFCWSGQNGDGNVMNDTYIVYSVYKNIGNESNTAVINSVAASGNTTQNNSWDGIYIDNGCHRLLGITAENESESVFKNFDIKNVVLNSGINTKPQANFSYLTKGTASHFQNFKICNLTVDGKQITGFSTSKDDANNGKLWVNGNGNLIEFCQTGDPCEIDSDNDGTVDCEDDCPNDPNKTIPGNCGCGVTETGDCNNSGGETGTPTDITDLKASKIECGEVTLIWGDVDGETAYRIRRKLPTDAAYTNLGDVNAGITTYTDKTAKENTSYIYMVRPVVDGVAVKVSNTLEVKTPTCSGTVIKDCEGVENGTAYIDNCGDCVGGNTGKTACSNSGGDCDGFEEKDGLLVIEMENTDFSGNWKKRTTIANYTGSGYIQWEGNQYFSNTSNGHIEIPITINNPGTYEFRMRVAIGDLSHGTTEHNDTWLKIVADNFYADRNGALIKPKPDCNNAAGYGCPEGSSLDGFFKMFGGNGWQWQNKTSDFDDHYVHAEFNKAGTYKIIIAARSSYHAIDRIMMYNKSMTTKAKAENLANAETKCTGGGTIDPTECNTEYTYNGINDFTNLNVTGFAPAYKDAARGALAINAVNYKDEFAAANLTFNGESGTYDFTITTMSELDGESIYKLVINGQTVGSFQNPETTTDYSLNTHTWKNIAIENGQKIQVEFNSHTNGKIPEGDITAYSRGRWTQLKLTCTDGNGGDNGDCTSWCNPQGVWQGKGRIAISSDGNEHDHDDWSATPLSLALIAAKGLQDQMVLYTYSDHIWGSNVNHDDAYDQMVESALGGKEWFGYDNSTFLCAVDNPNAAYNAMRDQILASTAEDPLYIIAAGPMQVVGEAIDRAYKHADYNGQLKHVIMISHSNWNNRHADNPTNGQDPDPHTGWTWDEINNAYSGKGLDLHLIKDQNGEDKNSGLRNQITKYAWIKNSAYKNDPHYKPGAWDWLYERQETCIKDGGTTFDPSDAGMIVYLFNGTENNEPVDCKNIMESPADPCSGNDPVDPACAFTIITKVTDASCDSNGSVALTISNYDTRTAVKYKIGDLAYSENIGTDKTYLVEDLATGTYQILATWGNGECADTKVGAATIYNNCTPSDLTDVKAVADNCESITLTWSDTGGETEYRIRRKISGEATFQKLDDVPADTETYIDSEVTVGVTYIYQVRPIVNDVATNSSNFPEITVPKCGTAETIQTITLKQGWNLVSLYIETNEMSPATVFPNAELVKTFDVFYDASQEPFLNSLQTLETGKGYLVYNSKDETIKINGIATNGNMSLKDGWNLIGITEETPINDLSSDIIIIKDFEAFYEKGNGLNTLNTLEKGKAYFIYK